MARDEERRIREGMMGFSLSARLSAGLDLLYPPTCLACEAAAQEVGGLCGGCWREVGFLAGRVCDRCGAALAHEAGSGAVCEDCARWPPGWDRGRAAARYGGPARTLVLALKHADRTEAARPMARWMARAGAALLTETDLLIPVPLHWTRRVSRRFNQAAELARALSAISGVASDSGLLLRARRTPSQDGKTREERRRNVAEAFRVGRGGERLRGRTVTLVDDVMTTGATLSAAAAALRAFEPKAVHALAFARVGRDDAPPIS